MKKPNPVFDWSEVARLALISRTIDEYEEEVLAPKGLVKYQFSAKGHELGQLLISQLLTSPGDASGAYYRSRPFMLGSGLTIEEALASDMAKIGGVSEGRDVGVVFNMPTRGRATILPMAGDVGSQYTPAAGWAQALIYRQKILGQKEFKNSIAVVFGGDGSVATSGFWSCLTMATTLNLPLLIVIEDNGYALSVKSELQTPGGDIAKNLDSFKNLTTWNGSGTQPAETADLVSQAVTHVRDGHGAGLLRLTVPRLSGHSSMDNQAYKTKDLIAKENKRDPLSALKDYLVPHIFSEQEWQDLAASAKNAVEAASQTVQLQPDPDPEKIERHLFFNPDQSQEDDSLGTEDISLTNLETIIQETNPRRINMIDGIRRTLDVELTVNPDCLIFGEDVALKGGVHTATMGLLAKHGPDRVFDTSLSEEGIIGRAVGLALNGLKPIAEIQFRKYADPAMEQINNCGTIRWRTAGRFAAPLVVRIPGGFGRKIGDPWHSVTGEIDFAHGVGWKLAFPSNIKDAVGLLRSAIRGKDPVIFFEHRALLDAAFSRGPYPGDEFTLPFGKAKLISHGDDLTVVSWGAMVERCQLAAERVGSGIELIDLRTLVPWDEELVLNSVKKTSKCLIVHEDIRLGGFGGEVASTIMEKNFFDLDGPIIRVGAPSVPVPFSPGLMQAVVPTISMIVQEMNKLLAY